MQKDIIGHWSQDPTICRPKHQSDWDIFMQQLTSAYNTQVNCLTGMTPLSFGLSRHTPAQMIFNHQILLLTEPLKATAPCVFLSKLFHHISLIWKKTDKKPTAAQHGTKLITIVVCAPQTAQTWSMGLCWLLWISRNNCPQTENYIVLKFSTANTWFIPHLLNYDRKFVDW